MPEPTRNRTTARCACGSVELEAAGAPIMSVACHCDDCQEGARRIEALPGAPPVRDPDGGTPYVLYPEDRLRSARGAELLKSYKLHDASATNRVVATCCNSAMFVNFDDGKHWIDVYRPRLQGNVPTLQMRVQTKHKPDTSDVPSDVPSYPAWPPEFMAKLRAARIAMLLRR